jgi:hypothetical protein
METDTFPKFLDSSEVCSRLTSQMGCSLTILIQFSQMMKCVERLKGEILIQQPDCIQPFASLWLSKTRRSSRLSNSSLSTS